MAGAARCKVPIPKRLSTKNHSDARLCAKRVLAATLPGIGQSHKRRAEMAPYLAVFGGMVHDDPGGRVLSRRSPLGMLWGRSEPAVTYRMSRRDRQGISRMLRILADTFCSRRARGVSADPGWAAGFPDGGITADDLRGIDLDKIPSQRFECASQHPLGSCRMGLSPDDAVVDEQGQVFGLRELFVVDSSILPTSLGVNPQVTVMAMATRLAWQLRERRLPGSGVTTVPSEVHGFCRAPIPASAKARTGHRSTTAGQDHCHLAKATAEAQPSPLPQPAALPKAARALRRFPDRPQRAALWDTAIPRHQLAKQLQKRLPGDVRHIKQHRFRQFLAQRIEQRKGLSRRQPLEILPSGWRGSRSSVASRAPSRLPRQSWRSSSTGFGKSGFDAAQIDAKNEQGEPGRLDAGRALGRFLRRADTIRIIAILPRECAIQRLALPAHRADRCAAPR